MVTFICYNCDKTLKKQQVEKHIKTQCRGPAKMICIDCKKMFSGDDHIQHTSCISEMQAYWGQYAKKPKQQQKQQQQQQQQQQEPKEDLQTNGVTDTEQKWPGWRIRVNQILKQQKKSKIKLDKIKKQVIQEYIELHEGNVDQEYVNNIFDEKILNSKKFDIVQVPYIVKKINKQSL